VNENNRYCGECEFLVDRKNGGKDDEYGKCVLTDDAVYDHFSCLNYERGKWMNIIDNLKAEFEAAKRAVAASRPYVVLYFARNPTACELTPANIEGVDTVIEYFRAQMEREKKDDGKGRIDG
jgi:hypothetical protein